MNFQDIETAYPTGMSEVDCQSFANKFRLSITFESKLGNDKICIFCKKNQYANLYCKVKINSKTEIMYCFTVFNLQPKDIDFETFLQNL